MADYIISGSAVSTGSFAKVEVSQKIGIGTNSPIGPLHSFIAGASYSHTYGYQQKGITIQADEPMMQLIAADNNTHGGSILIRYGDNVFSTVANTTADNLEFSYAVTSGNNFNMHGGGSQVSSFQNIMVLNKGGNVGIGETSPDTPLHVTGDGGITLEESGGTTRKLIITPPTAAATGIISNNGTSAGLVIKTDGGGASQLFLKNDGNVGIGTTSPNTKLDVRGAITVDETAGTTNSAVLNLVADRGSADQDSAEIRLRNNSATSYTRLVGVRGSGDTHGGFQIRTRNSSGEGTRLAISEAGNVGIGTTSPDTKLHLEDTSDVYLTLESTHGSTPEEVAIKYSNASTSTNYWWVGLNQSDDFSIAYGTIFNAASTRFNILDTGLVGIGTNAPIRPLDIVVASGDNTIRMATASQAVDVINLRDNDGRVGFGGDVITVKSSKVGIGPTTPEAIGLHIQKASTDTSINLDDKGHYHLVLQNNDGASQNTGRHVGIMMQINSNSQAADASIYTEFEENGGAKLHFTTTKSGTGQERMVIDSDGLVGIGNTSPSKPLTVAGEISSSLSGNNNSTFRSTSGGARIILDSTTNETTTGIIFKEAGAQEASIIYDHSDDSLDFRTGGADATMMTINHAGNVGIGQTSPAYKMHISSSDEKTMQFDRAGQETYRLTHGTSGLFFTKPNSVGIAYGVTQDGDFVTYNSSGNVMFQSDASSGNVGIGVTSPNTKLHIKGAGEILRIENDTNASGNTYISFHDTSAVKGYLGYTGGSSDHLNIWNVENAHVKIATNNTERITVLGGGNVGIGTTSPTARLHVIGDTIITGNLTAKQLIVSSSVTNMTVAQASGSTIFGDTVSTDTHQFSGSLNVTGSITLNGSAVTSGGGGGGVTISNNADNRVLTGDGSNANAEANLIFNGSKLGVGGSAFLNKTLEVLLNNAETDVTAEGLLGGTAGAGVLIHNTNTTNNNFANLDFRAQDGDARIAVQRTATNTSQMHFVMDNAGTAKNAMTIKNDGKVGIGTTSPDYNLEVLDTGFNAIGISRSGYQDAKIGITNVGGSGDQALEFDANAYEFRVDGTAGKLVLLNNGNVGIGQTSPAKALHIGDASNNTGNGTIRLQGYSAGGSGNYHDIISEGDNLTFKRNTTQLLFLQYNGKVGIGNAAPAHELDVTGTIQASGNISGSSTSTGSFGKVMAGHGRISNASSDTSFIVSRDDQQSIELHATGRGNVRSGGELSLQTNGSSTTRVLVDTSGNVGIGTTSPSGPLHVYHATTNGVALFESGDGQGGIALKDNSTSNNVFLLATGDDFGIQTGGVANRLTVKSDGKVGIGDETPQYALEIRNTTGDVRVSSNTNTNRSGYQSGNAGGTSYFYRESSAGASALGGSSAYATVVGGGGNYPLQLGTNDAVRMTITGGGNVGIGTTTPDNVKFHVHGNSIVGDASVSNSTSFMEVRGFGAVGKLKAHGHGVSTSGATISDSIMLEAEASAAQGLVLATANSSAPIRFYTNGGLRMTIDSSGDVTFTGKISATSKSFLIDHPTKENKKLQYASLEGPENGVYVRGKLEGDVIELPDYWVGLVHEDSITVNLTPIGKYQHLYVEHIKDNKVFVNCVGDSEIKCFYTIYGERKDIEKLEVEF